MADFDWDSLLGGFSSEMPTDWLSAVAGGADLSNMVLDTATGQLVDIASLSPEDLTDLDGEGLTGGGSGQLNLGPSSTSTSDHLRSLQADPNTPGSEPFDWNAMADPSASIASADDNGWGKALAQGLSNALSGAGGGLKGLMGDPSGGGPTPGGAGGLAGGQPSLMGDPGLVGDPGRLSGGAPSVLGDLMGPPSGGGLQSLLHPGSQDAVGAQYTATAGVPRSPLTMQSAIDPGPAPRPFTPLALPTAGGPLPMAGQAPMPRLSGLQRLLSERLG